MAHRYWRVRCLTNTANQYGALSEIQMADSTGNRIGSGTPFASPSQSDHPANYAIDGNLDSYWGGGQALPSWWGYDFITAVDITSVTITSNSILTPYSPIQWLLEYSEDASFWTTLQAFLANTWVANTPQLFNVGATLVAAQYWRIYTNSTVQGSYTEIAEVSMTTSAGGFNLIGAGTPSSDSFYDSGTHADAACDGNPLTFWANGNVGVPSWWAYDFTAPVSIVEVIITPRSDAYANASPSFWQLQASTDNTTWNTVQCFYSGPWTLAQPQTFDLYGTVLTDANAQVLQYYGEVLFSGMDAVRSGQSLIEVLFNRNTISTLNVGQAYIEVLLPGVAQSVVDVAVDEIRPNFFML